MVSILPITPADHDEWAALWSEYLEFYETELDETTTATTFRRLTTDGSGVHGAIARTSEGADAGTAVGIVHWLNHASTWAIGDYCYLEDLYVLPTVRRGGVGAALIEHVRQWAADHGAAKVYWLTAQSNRTARGLYDRVATDTGFVHYEIELTP